jgi:LPXTG-motif cell wall-anchored protein
MPSAPTLPAAAAPTGADKSFPLDALLNLGVQAAATVGAARRASGASASRQQRVAACGRRPLFGKARKEEYAKCVANAEGGNYSDRAADTNFPPAPQSNNMTFVYVGLGLVVVSGLAYFLLKKK